MGWAWGRGVTRCPGPCTHLLFNVCQRFDGQVPEGRESLVGGSGLQEGLAPALPPAPPPALWFPSLHCRPSGCPLPFLGTQSRDRMGPLTHQGATALALESGVQCEGNPVHGWKHRPGEESV